VDPIPSTMRLVQKKTSPRKRQTGGIHTLPSGSLRVRVYAGIDPVKKKKLYLEETVPAGPDAWDKAHRHLRHPAGLGRQAAGRLPGPPVGALTHSAPALDTSPLISPFEPQEQTVRP
jgi:hypothetical protein